jgi:hypothetical protein
MTIDYAIEENQKFFKIFFHRRPVWAGFSPNPDDPSRILSSFTCDKNVLFVFVSQPGYIGIDIF